MILPYEYNGIGVSFFGSKVAGDVKLSTHLYLVARLRMLELYLHSPICFDGVMLN
jgi:hypothetical protein